MMQNMGHYDAQVKASVKKVGGGGTLMDLTKVEMLLMELGYQVVYLKNKLNFNALTHLFEQFSLPMLVSLKLDSNDLGHEHVIGICPHIASKGSPVQYRIVDGGHPQLQSIEYSLENLNWCCGGLLLHVPEGALYL